MFRDNLTVYRAHLRDRYRSFTADIRTLEGVRMGHSNQSYDAEMRVFRSARTEVYAQLMVIDDIEDLSEEQQARLLKVLFEIGRLTEAGVVPLCMDALNRYKMFLQRRHTSVVLDQTTQNQTALNDQRLEILARLELIGSLENEPEHEQKRILAVLSGVALVAQVAQEEPRCFETI